MPDVSPLNLVDAALRGMVVALAVLLAAVLRRDLPRLPAARAGVAMTLGLSVQAVSSAPLFEAMVPRLWQAPWVAVSVGNAVLFWIFVQALFDDDFTLRPAHLAAWAGAAALSGFNCAVAAGSASVLAPVTMGLQRAVPLVCAALAAVAAAAHWRADLVEPRRRLRVFILVTGIAYTLAMLVARLASPHGRLSDVAATADVSILLVILAVVAAGCSTWAHPICFLRRAAQCRRPAPRARSRPGWISRSLLPSTCPCRPPTRQKSVWPRRCNA